MGALLILLGVVFVILKLLGIIAWSWWLVTAPLIAAGILLFLFFVFFGGFVFTAMALTRPTGRRRLF